MLPDYLVPMKVFAESAANLHQTIRREIMPETLRRVCKGPLFRFSQDPAGNATVTILESHEGAARTLSANPDGDISDSDKHNRPLFPNYAPDVKRHIRTLRRELLKDAANRLGPRAAAVLNLDYGTDFPMLRETIYRCRNPHYTRLINSRHASKTLNGYVKDHLADPRACRLLLRILGHPRRITAANHNAALTCPETLESYYRQHPATTRLYLSHLVKPSDRPGTAAQLTALIRARVKTAKHDDALLHAAARTLDFRTPTAPEKAVRDIMEILRRTPPDTGLNPEEILHMAGLPEPEQPAAGVQNNPDSAGTRRQRQKETIRFLSLERSIQSAKEDILRQLKNHTPYSRPNPHTIRYTPIPGRNPYSQLAFLPNGEISTDPDRNRTASGGATPDTLNTQPPSIEELRIWAKGELAERTCKQFGGPGEMAYILQQPNATPESRRVARAFSKAANAIAGAAYALRRHSRDVEPLLDPHTLELTHKLFQSYNANRPAVYNWTHRNRNTLNKLETTSPGIAGFYCVHLLLRTDTDMEETVNPSSIVKALKTRTGLNSAEWRAFLHIGPGHFEQYLTPHREQELTLICRAVAEANRPEATPELLNQVLQYRQDFSRYATETNWSHGDPWKAWVHILSQFLNPGKPGRAATQRNRFSYVAEAFRDHIQRNLPWGTGDWRTLCLRAGRWRNRLQANRPQLSEEELELSWTSHLPDHTEQDVAIHPVTDGKALQKLALRMGNCLASYTHPCHRGSSRIFLLTGAGGETAATEIAFSGGAWRLNQLEAPQRDEVPEPLQRAAATLPEKYTQAQQSATEFARHGA